MSKLKNDYTSVEHFLLALVGIVEGLARRIVSGDVPDALKKKRIMRHPPERIVGVSVPNGGKVVASCT